LLQQFYFPAEAGVLFFKAIDIILELAIFGIH